jgi:hypothetical protein
MAREHRIKGQIKNVASQDKCERSMGRSGENCVHNAKGGNTLSAVLLFVVGRT